MGFLEGKRGLIVGLASNRSIAWGIAQAMHREGATLAFTYQNEKLKDRVESLAPEVGSSLCLPCDVSSDEEIRVLFDRLGHEWGSLDILVHSVAYAPKEQLEGNFLDTVTRDGFRTAQDVSAYSLAALAKAARPLMRGRKAAIVAMTYLGAVRAVPPYNVMGIAKASLEATVRYMADNLGPEGIRVNAVSAGPIRTLAAAGISDFRRLLDYSERNTPLRRNVTIEEVGNVAAFLCSDLAAGVTGDVVYVDSGFHVTAMGSGPL